MGEIGRIRIDDIKIADRVRKDMGNLEELAESIKELGLLQPVVVTPELVLVAGERRLRACQMLGWKEIEVVERTFEDHLAQLKAQRDENIARKSFTFSEMVELGMKLEAVEKERARTRSLANLRQYQECQDVVIEDGDGNKSTECLNSDTRGRTDELVAKTIGFGGRDTYRKAKFVAEHADPELIEKLDAGEISVHRAYRELKAKLEAVQKEAGEAKAREEAERRRAEELATRLDEVEKALAEARVGSVEAERLRIETEKLRQELKNIRSHPPEVVERVVEKVVEVPVEIEKPVPDPALEAELEAVRAEAAKLLREKEWFENRFRDMAQEKERKEAKIRTLEEEVEKLNRWLDHARKELEKEKSRPKPPQWSKEHLEFQGLLQEASRSAASLASVLVQILEKHRDRLLGAARVRGAPGDDLRELAEAAGDVLLFKAFDAALKAAVSKAVEVWDVLEPGKPKLQVVKGKGKE